MVAQHTDGIRLFVYALCEPDGRTIRYIGLTANLWKRLLNHYRHSCMVKVRTWVNDLRRRGMVPSLIVLHEVQGIEAGKEAEAKAIAEHKKILGDQLFNQVYAGVPTAKRRRRGLVEFGGQKKTLAEWARELGISRQALDLRLQRHPIQIALSRGKDSSCALAPTEPPPKLEYGSQSVVIEVDPRHCVSRGLTHGERRERRKAMALAVHRGATVAEVSKAYGVTTATVSEAADEFPVDSLAEATA